MAVVPYKNSTENKKKQVARMFDNISAKYDFLNHFLSVGIDIAWRKKAVKLLASKNPKTILDVATGTADFAIEAAKLNPDKIEGIDISEGMLDVGRKKIEKKGLKHIIQLHIGDSEEIHFPDNHFDAVIVSFGVRNFENLEMGLENMFRVLKPGGDLAIIEFSQPHIFPFKQLYSLYFNYLLPAVGKMISKDNSAYNYLPESVSKFPYGEAFLEKLRKAGFKDGKSIPLTFGISSIYLAQK